jgi:4-diphosphocytidyl-2-C-methyl-D-erythritol kinase
VSDRSVRVRAFAKINVTLRVLGSSDGGYHELRTVFQSIGVYDTLTFTSTRSGWSIDCSDPRCPADRTNLVWRAAESLWHDMGRRGMPSVRVHLRKRIPVQAGLGGGSSDAAATLRALAHVWRFKLSQERLQALCRPLGADVPYFLHGGTMLGLGRGDLLFRLADWPQSWVVLVVPEAGVRTADAYSWWDRQSRRSSKARGTIPATTLIAPAADLTNDLQGPVVAHYPALARLPDELRRRGAYHAMLSGSGSAIFGLFEREGTARSAAATLSRRHATVVTRTVSRRRFEAASTPYAGPTPRR